LSGDDRFEILISPEIGDGVHTHAQKFIDSSPDGLELIAKHVPHTETALELLLDGHGDMVAVSENGGTTIGLEIFLPHLFYQDANQREFWLEKTNLNIFQKMVSS